ncbi:efflux RND transporter periplasmic adaptor subunit [Parvularcula sp. LCG005]|uniref:efflux RND transporter periplasmic adaptor subunit n=1 Tax=Parvularcula sp. LCG005 TaxID=3078805 RepID=UPI002942FACA|nr:efflux RND transporter periplasmic adaptor subunit [Parvularcula sp. LCG005]WOI52504.1 efflux RND transporter periplasmic adaptor subunit [Parvularcula sp. LCG005]
MKMLFGDNTWSRQNGQARRGGVIASVMLMSAALAGCGGDEAAQGAPGGGAPQGVRVTTVDVQPQAVEITAELQGRTRAYAVSEIRPQVSGLIEKRIFEEGQNVEEGDPLYQIDASEYQAALDSAKASLARTRANAQVAAQNADRLKGLVDINAVSRQQADEADAAAKQAAADVAMQQAALVQAQINLDRTTIKAPISGKIGRSTVTQGALVTQNQAQALATVRQLDPLYVDMTASAADVLKWKRHFARTDMVGADPREVPVNVILEDGSAYEHQGQLAFSEVSVDESAGTVVLRAIVPNPDGFLLPGMFVRASLPVGEIADAVLVPQAGVMRAPNGAAYALVATAEGMSEQRILTVEQAQGGNWVVTDGLGAGEDVIVTGLQMLRPGMPVTVVNAPDGGQGGAVASSAAE